MIELCIGNEKAYGQTFNCGTGNAISVRELADMIIEISGKEIDVEHGESRKGDIMHSQADISKAKKILNYQPSIELKEGLAELF